MATRERILDAAMDVFAQFGFRHASVDQVAQQAGLTRQAVYHHFKSKEALFRATVETLHHCALEAEAEAGRECEAAGCDLDEILASQIEARFRSLLDCLKETSQPEELLSARQIQTRDLNQNFLEHSISLHAATIARLCATRGLRLSDGMSPLDLARSIQLAIRGFNDLRLDPGALEDIGRLVRLIVKGAVEARPRARTRKPRREAKRQPRRRSSRRPSRAQP